MSESDIVSAICNYLTLKRRFFWRQNNLPVFDTSRGAFRRLPKYTMKGTPDVIVIDNGRFVGLEVKQKAGRQSPEQKNFERLCKEHGAEYYVVRSIDDVREVGL